MLSKESIKALESYLPPLVDQDSTLKSLRDRYTLIDKYVSKESALDKDSLQSKQAAEQGNKKTHRSIEVALCHTYAETTLAFYSSVFLSGFPIFAVVAEREQQEVASMLTALCGRDQIRFNWTKNLMQCLADGIKYNVMATEVTWEQKLGTQVATQTRSGSAQTGTHRAVVYKGNKLKRISPYNLFWDQTVPLDLVHEIGAYIGYIERANYIQLKQFIHGLNDAFLVKMNLNAIFTSQLRAEGRFYVPQIRRTDSVTRNNSWEHFFGFDSKNKTQGGGRYEVVTAYTRIIPKEYRISVPRAGEPQVFKCIWVNDMLLYVEPIIAGHEYLPIILSQLNDDGTGLEAKSKVEFLMDHQDLATSTITATIASMRRAVADRGLYNPQRIKSADINSAEPTAKIPVRFTSYDKGFENAYQHLPYNDTVSPLFKDNFGMIMGLSDTVSGANRSQQGAFQKGNRTQFEYDDVMKNQQGRLLLNALGLEASHFAPLKQILKINYLMYAVPEKVMDMAARKQINIDPQKMREDEADFKMSDGLLPSTKLANTEMASQAIGLFNQDPSLALEYDLAGMMVSVMHQSGFTGLDDFKRTPEQKQAKMAEMQQAAAAQQVPPAQPQR